MQQQVQWQLQRTRAVWRAGIGMLQRRTQHGGLQWCIRQGRLQRSKQRGHPPPPAAACKPHVPAHLLAGGAILSRDVEDAVGIDVESHVDLGHAAGRGRDACAGGGREGTQAFRRDK